MSPAAHCKFPDSSSTDIRICACTTRTTIAVLKNSYLESTISLDPPLTVSKIPQSCRPTQASPQLHTPPSAQAAPQTDRPEARTTLINHTQTPAVPPLVLLHKTPAAPSSKKPDHTILMVASCLAALKAQMVNHAFKTLEMLKSRT